MLKKTMALVLTFVMTAALAVPMVALAAGSSDYTSSDMNSADKTEFSSGQSGESKITFKAKTDVPVLNITITGGGGLVMNPYGIARNSTEFGITNEKSQIISTTLTISSQTIVPVKVGATVQAVVTPAVAANPITLATSVTDRDTTKKIALYLAAAKDANTAGGTFTTFPTKDVSGDETTPGILLVKTPYDATKKTGAVTNASIYTIPAGVAGTPKTCVMRFFGKMVAEPLNDPWVPGDKVEPTVILNFQLQKVAANG